MHAGDEQLQPLRPANRHAGVERQHAKPPCTCACMRAAAAAAAAALPARTLFVVTSRCASAASCRCAVSWQPCRWRHWCSRPRLASHSCCRKAVSGVAVRLTASASHTSNTSCRIASSRRSSAALGRVLRLRASVHLSEGCGRARRRPRFACISNRLSRASEVPRACRCAACAAPALVDAVLPPRVAKALLNDLGADARAGMGAAMQGERRSAAASWRRLLQHARARRAPPRRTCSSRSRWCATRSWAFSVGPARYCWCSTDGRTSQSAKSSRGGPAKGS